MKILFATNNHNKLKELRYALPKGIELLGLEEAGIQGDIPEDHETLEENAIQKAQYVYKQTGVRCFADDTGLEIEALNGAPGVYSARYAGDERSAEANMVRILKELKDIEDRKACFRTVIALVGPNGTELFEGKVNGQILREKRGTKGFGYDPIFQPEGDERSFAEMDLVEKNTMSHRALAFKKLVSHLRSET